MTINQTEAQRFNQLYSKYCGFSGFIRRTVSKRTQEIEVYRQGTRLASKLLIYKRGKVAETHYSITAEGITESNP